MWIIPFSDIQTPIDILFETLSKEEQIIANSFYKLKDKNNYIYSHAYLRLLLSKFYSNIEPSQWEFTKNGYGKPYISSEHNIELFFNISHSDNYLAVIFDTKNECGIDIQESGGIVIDKGIVDLVLSKREKEIYYSSEDRESIFYTFWTLKEAYLKALGRGFSLSPDSVDFSDINDIGEIRKGDYNLKTKRLDDDLFISYAIKS